MTTDQRIDNLAAGVKRIVEVLTALEDTVAGLENEVNALARETAEAKDLLRRAYLGR